MALGHGGDETVDHPAGRQAVLAASTVDARSRLEIGGRVESQKFETQEQSPKVRLPPIVPCAGHDFHEYGLGDGQWALIRDELGQP